MPVERWSTAQISAAAPDASSLKGARSVDSPAKWESAGLLDDEVLWGLCKGSGRVPYQVCVDLGGPAFKCSCPSRKFPCKHALGLLLMWADAAPSAPAFVHEWRTARAAKASAPTRAAKATDPAAAAKRAQQREERVAGGLAELGRWLDDQVEQGLAAAERGGHRAFDTMAARLVDAQAPAAASAVRRLGEIAGIGPHWADRLLGELALLRLLVTGHARLDELDTGLAATVRSRIGFPVSTEDVLATEPLRDRWQVLGQHDSDDGTITTRRTWLLGADSGRHALHLSFAAPGQTLATDLVPGLAFDGDLCFYPGAAPLRAIIKERRGIARPFPSPTGASDLPAALAAWSDRVAAEPWTRTAPMLLAAVSPSSDGYLTDPAGLALPLAAGHREPWWLLAAAGGAPTTVFGEWTPEGLIPRAAWVSGRFVPAGSYVPAGSGGPGRGGAELPPALLAAALVGTGRRPFDTACVEVAGATLVGAARRSDPDPGSGLYPGEDPDPGEDPGADPGEDEAAAEPRAGAGGSVRRASLLEAAAVALVYRRAGTTAVAGHPAIAPAPAETEPPLPVAAGVRLIRILSDGGAPGGSHQAQELLSQWLGAAVARGGWVPPEALPPLLDAARRNSAFRPAVARVAGERGRWLAAQRADWRWLGDEAPVAVGDEQTWETGSPGERLAYLTRLRGVDPAAGLALLRGTWRSEAAPERARFLGALATGLGAGDDAFLDAALDDRRKEVREAALDLLQRLPGAGLGARMAARALAAVRLTGQGTLDVTPPAELTAELRRDGLAAQPARGTGVQAWLLEEVIAGTPLATWSDAFGREPAAVVALAREHDWEVPLLHGWAKAAIAQGSPQWATALVGADGAGVLREAVRWDLHLLLPPAELARIAADFLRREDHLAHRLLAVHPGAWPAELAAAVADTIERRARKDKHSWQLAELCRAAATAMPPAWAPRITGLAARLDQDLADPSRSAAVAELARTLTFRNEMLQEFQ